MCVSVSVSLKVFVISHMMSHAFGNFMKNACLGAAVVWLAVVVMSLPTRFHILACSGLLSRLHELLRASHRTGAGDSAKL